MSKQDQRRKDDATERLFAHAPAAHAIHKAGRKMKREQNRREWYAKHRNDK